MPSPVPDPVNPPHPRAGLWPTLVTLVGMLAVLLGVQASRFEPARTLTASAHTLPLPEFRAVAPLPAPTGGAAPESPLSAQVQVLHHEAERSQVSPPTPDAPHPSLALYGRRQAEGG